MNKLFLATLFLFPTLLLAQSSTIIGFVKDKQSDEPIPFASAKLQMLGSGVLTDSAGKFTLAINRAIKNDTLLISSVGYKVLRIPFNKLHDSVALTCKLELLPPPQEAVVKAKYSRSLWFWKRIMHFKPLHEKEYWNNYAYEIYNKLEVDLENLNKQKLTKNKLLKPLNFVLNYVDSTSEEKPFLPAYITETLSDYYYQKNPHRAKEVIKATRTNGLENESMIKQLGGMYQNINVYDNFILIFNRQFIGPFNDNAPNYYNYKLLDTQYLSKRRLVHLRFTPKHKGEDVFEGDCWVNDTSFAIQKITLRPAAESNLNFVSAMSLIQEFRLVNDSIWFLYKDKFVADITPIGAKNIGLKGRKTTTYKNIQLNSSNTENILQTIKKAEEIDLAPNVINESDSFWLKNRHELLNKSEQAVYKLLDTLVKNPTYIHYRNGLQFFARGTKDVGNFRIGPWFYWFSGNQWEGIRTRFDIATNKDFDKHWYFRTYLAYGFKDATLKGKLEAKYQISRNPWSYIGFSYRNDLDNGQIYYDQLGTDNVFSTLLRRPNIPFKFQSSIEKKLEWYQETNKGFGFGISATSKQQKALLNLPSQDLFPVKTGQEAFNNFETALRIRFAYLERSIEDNFTRISLGSDFPIVEFKYAHGFPNVLKSSYTYDKVELSVSDYVSLAPYGKLYYNLFGGKTYGILPYNLLQILPGNELAYYNRFGFNLLNRFEYIADTYTGINLEHNIGNGLFKYIPLTRKLKFRQFWEAKAITASLSQANQQLNFVGNYPYKNLNGKVYLEVGTGVDNIFKFFRVDFVWHVLPTPQPTETIRKFGVFGSFRFTF